MTRAKIKETEVILAERKAEVDNFKAVAKQYQSQKVNMEKISVFLPRIKQIDELVMTIKTASDQNGLQLNGLSIAGANEAGATRYRRSFIKTELTGTYPFLMNFFKDLEKSLRLLDVLEINIGRDPLATGSNGLSFEIKINAYYQAE
jgi:Tfp pilus assembly protein PilO